MSIFKDSFTPAVRDQLTARGNAFTKRTSSDIIYINGRAAWARMTSGVDVNDSDTLARENVLQGGVLDRFGQVNGYDKYDLRQGVGKDYRTNAYSNRTDGPLGTTSNLHGLVPMPGITNVSVDSRSAYGSVRVATVTFNCWDIKQLELMELLYMRPGFLVLLEWGWSPYLRNNGSLEPNSSLYQDMFTAPINPKTNKRKSLQDRLIDVYNKSVENDANYEGIFGYIKNYSWSARPDGGYDCTTEIISTGEILESLKVNYSVNFIPSDQLRAGLLFKSPSDYSDNIEKLYKTNIIAGLVGELIFKAYRGVTAGEINQAFGTGNPLSLYLQATVPLVWESGINISIPDPEGNITGIPNSEITLFGLDINPEGPASDADKIKNNGIEPDRQVYIDLSTFIAILNKWVIPVDKVTKSPIIPLSLKDRAYETDTENPNDLLCLYHPLQISMDPSVCLIKNTKIRGLKNVSVQGQNIASTFDPKNIYADNKTKQLISYTFKSLVKSMLEKLVNASINPDRLEDRIEIINNSINAMITTATSKGLTKSEATEIIANVWEDYKYVNTSATPRFGTQTINPLAANSFEYYIPVDNTSLYISKEYEIGGDNSSAKNEIAELTFLEVLRYSLDLSGAIDSAVIETSLKVALGDNYSEFYKATDEVRNFSISQVKEKINVAENEGLTQALQFDAIKFLENLNLNYEYNNTGFGTIGNIYINLNNVLNLVLSGNLESNDVKEKREINLYDFLKRIMNQVQSSIGSINNFDIHVDPIDNIARIIDINYVDAVKSKAEAYKNAYTFLSKSPTEFDAKLDGLFNNIRSYKINSQIFKEQSSIVAISAQNGGGVMGLDNETLVGFNRGITNRLLLDSNPRALYNYSEEIKNSDLINTLNSSLSILYTFLKDLNWIEDQIIYWDKTRKYKTDQSGQYKNILRDFIAVYQFISTTPSSYRSIIPTTVSLELDGIGGLIIGHMFRLPSELLPAGYKTIDGIGRKQGFIITKLGHRISNSDWVTNVDAQTILLEDNINSKAFDLNRALEVAAEGSKVKISTSGQVTTSDQVSTGIPINISKKPLVEQIIRYAKSKGINDPQRLTAILTVAQAETSLNPLEVESLRYSVDRAKVVFPGKLRGKTDAQIAQIFSNELSAGEFLYGGQFGNNQPGDGAKYRGRGLTQITFKGNYIAMNNNLKKAGENIDIVNNPELANQSDNSIKILVVGKLYGQFGDLLKQGVNYRNSASNIIRTQNGGQSPNAETLLVYANALASINSTTWIQDLLK
jgi:predicted chitinase